MCVPPQEELSPLVMLAVGNSRQTAAAFQVCPHALLDDGMLDLSYMAGEGPLHQVSM